MRTRSGANRENIAFCWVGGVWPAAYASEDDDDENHQAIADRIAADVAVGGDHFETFIVKGDHEGGKAQLHRDKCEVAKKYMRREPLGGSLDTREI